MTTKQIIKEYKKYAERNLNYVYGTTSVGLCDFFREMQIKRLITYDEYNNLNDELLDQMRKSKAHMYNAQDCGDGNFIKSKVEFNVKGYFRWHPLKTGCRIKWLKNNY